MQRVIGPYPLHELEAIRESFLYELRLAVNGRSKCISHLSHRINRKRLPDSGSCLCIVVGGSTLQTASARLEGSSVVINGSLQRPLPVLSSKDILFGLLDGLIKPGTGLIGLNFAFPLEPEVRDGILDGRLKKGTKSHAMTGIVGTLVGDTLEKHARTNGCPDVSVVAANDTVCLILTGVTGFPPESLIGGVVGTGFNFGLFLDENTILNLESGNFNNFQQSEAGRYIDMVSNNPDNQLFEKEVSGAYLYRHFNYYAERQGLDKRVSSSRELSDLAATEGDGAILAETVINRAASLVAVQIASMSDFKGPMKLNALIEGSVFWKSWHFRENVIRTLVKLGIDEDRVSFVPIEDSSVLGAACLAFLCS